MQKSQACVSCHGANGISPFPDYPNLAGQKAAYLLDAMRSYKDGRRNHAAMKAMIGPLSAQDLRDVAAWYASLGPCPPEPLAPEPQP